MIKKLIFAGCSVTAGNELWEEEHIPGYTSMDFNQARKIMEKVVDMKAVDRYNRSHSYSAIVGEKLGVETVNLGIPGISNKEIAMRVISYFPEERYEDTVVFMQFTTHNRLFLKYKEENGHGVCGSFAVMAKADDHRLSKHQNNLLKETFFEFFPDEIMVIDDHIFMYYAVEVLKSKNITAFILWPSVEIIDWANWDLKTGFSTRKEIPYHNDKEPVFVHQLSQHIAGTHHKYNPIGDTLNELVGKNSHLPRFHYKRSAHEKIAEALLEKLKNV
jgi:hypothetical protein